MLFRRRKNLGFWERLGSFFWPRKSVWRSFPYYAKRVLRLTATPHAIAAGVAGLGTLVARSPVLITGVTVGGALFLFAYALFAFRRAVHPDALHAARGGATSLKAAVGACLAFTFLNPHVYLDTVLLVGSLSGAYQGAARTSFAGGAIAASFLWFFGLGYGARLLQPVFARPRAWRVLDTLIGLVMVALGSTLVARLV
jgi:L-lysine exporter family protein LysE/ArgO